jgi:hypothetical protein
VRVAPAELALLRKGLPREAVERLVRRAGVSEDDASRALLDEASRELERASGHGGTVVALVAVIGFFLWMIILAL